MPHTPETVSCIHAVKRLHDICETDVVRFACNHESVKNRQNAAHRIEMKNQIREKVISIIYDGIFNPM